MALVEKLAIGAIVVVTRLQPVPLFVGRKRLMVTRIAVVVAMATTGVRTGLGLALPVKAEEMRMVKRGPEIQ